MSIKLFGLLKKSVISGFDYYRRIFHALMNVVNDTFGIVIFATFVDHGRQLHKSFLNSHTLMCEEHTLDNVHINGLLPEKPMDVFHKEGNFLCFCLDSMHI